MEQSLQHFVPEKQMKGLMLLSMQGTGEQPGRIQWCSLSCCRKFQTDGKSEEHSEEENDVEPLELVLLGATLE